MISVGTLVLVRRQYRAQMGVQHHHRPPVVKAWCEFGDTVHPSAGHPHRRRHNVSRLKNHNSSFRKYLTSGFFDFSTDLLVKNWCSFFLPLTVSGSMILFSPEKLCFLANIIFRFKPFSCQCRCKRPLE